MGLITPWFATLLQALIDNNRMLLEKKVKAHHIGKSPPGPAPFNVGDVDTRAAIYSHGHTRIPRRIQDSRTLFL